MVGRRRLRRRGGGAAPAGNASREVQSFHVQGNVWLLTGGGFNAAVQIGDDGVLVVDTLERAAGREAHRGDQAAAPATSRSATIINTHVHPDHTGGNAKVAEAGESIVAGNFAPQVGPAAAGRGVHLRARERAEPDGQPAGQPIPSCPSRPGRPTRSSPTRRRSTSTARRCRCSTSPTPTPTATSSCTSASRTCVAAGDIFVTTTFPVINVAQGGSLNGIVTALNRIIDITVPKDKQEGGTYVIPGHGRLTDEADVVDYRDMMTIIRDRFQDAVEEEDDAGAGEGGAAGARLRAAIRRGAGLLDHGRVRRGGVSQHVAAGGGDLEPVETFTSGTKDGTMKYGIAGRGTRGKRRLLWRPSRAAGRVRLPPRRVRRLRGRRRRST